MSERLAALAKRAEGDPYFLAQALAAYAHAEGLTDAALAQRLGCLPSRLSAIRLCRKPRPEATQFQHDVDRIAEAYQIDGGVIAEAVRLADALAALGQMGDEGGSLLAARDRERDEPDENAGQAEPR